MTPWQSRVAWAQPAGKGKNSPTQARKLFAEAQELRQAGKPGPALAKLREAYDALPTPTLLWPIAELCAQLQQPVEGLDALSKYRAQMTPDQMEPGQQLADAEKLEARLRAQLGHLVVSGGAGALVVIDGREVGHGPFVDKIAVNPGSHKVVASSSRGNAEATFEVVSGGEAKVSLPDGPIEKGSVVVSNGDRNKNGTPSEGSPTGSSDGRYFPHRWTWLAIGVTGATLVSATIVGAAALAKTRSLDEQCQDQLCLGGSGVDIGQLNSEAALQGRLSGAAIALWTVGSVMAVGTTVLIVIDAQRQKEGRSLVAARSRLGSELGITLDLPRAAVGTDGMGATRFDLTLGGRF